jgi:signal transduction histidine kinase
VSAATSSSRWRLAGDTALALVLLGLGMAEIWAALPSRSGSGSAGWTSVAVVLCTVPLVVRRIRPVAVVAVVTVGMFALYAAVPLYVLFYGTFVPLAVAAFSVARHAGARGASYGAGYLALGIVGVTIFAPGQRTPGSLAFNIGGLGLAWLAGRALAVFEERAADARRRAVESEVAAATMAMSAVLDERTRIARELHDIVAHAVSLIVVQAGAAEAEVEENPAFARDALRAIRSTGTGALAEMRRMVSMLREADEPDLLSPQPGVDGLPDLVARTRDGGLDATLTVDGTAGPLPSGLDLAVYRIVQEALSNVRRHASASRAEVRLAYHPDRLDLEVTDDGVGAVTGAPSPGGHGLIGMRERAALYGGRLETTAAPGAGFTVRAVLPLAAS